MKTLMDATSRWGKRAVILIVLFAAVHLGIVALVGVAGLGAEQATLVLPLIRAARVASPCALLVAAIAFLTWVHAAHEGALRLEKGFLVCAPGTAVWSYFIPIVSLYKPIANMYVLVRASDPSDLPIVAEQRVRDNPRYRDAAIETVPPKPFGVDVPVTPWWIAWYGGSVCTLILAYAGTPSLGKAAFANLLIVGQCVPWVLLVRGITRCQLERARRIAARDERPADAVV